MSRSYTRKKKRTAAHQRREQATRARELDRRAVKRSKVKVDEAVSW